MEAQLMALAIETYKITLILSLPMLLAGLIVGLMISIFQATTQINEQTLTFVPKILVVIIVVIMTMPWMLNMLIDFTSRMLQLIPEFPF
ncbi:MAG: flagellar biosynthesis protein FliQ [Wolinella sp.]